MHTLPFLKQMSRNRAARGIGLHARSGRKGGPDADEADRKRESVADEGGGVERKFFDFLNNYF